MHPTSDRDGGAHVLIVEDDESTAILIRAIVLRHGFRCGATIVGDGHRAIDYLLGRPPFADRSLHPFPTLVILDLGLPGLGGFEVLEWMAANPATLEAPVVVFSGSADPADARRAYALGARAFLRKSADPTGLVDVVRDVLVRWTEEARDGTRG